MKREIPGRQHALLAARLAQQQRRLERFNDLLKATRTVRSTGIAMPALAAPPKTTNPVLSRPPPKKKSGFAEKYLGREIKCAS
jgi:hypothetical protein